MTIKQLHETTPQRTIIYIVTGATCHELERENPIDIELYGRYAIAQISAIGENEIEAIIKITFVTEE